MIRSVLTVMAAAVPGLAAPFTARAQQSAPPPSKQAPADTVVQGASETGSILGTVTDSLHGGALVHAVVTVMQLPQHSALTSDVGAFRIDSIPPGRYTLELSHVVLDSLGIRVVSDTVPVTAGAVQTVTLTIPGAQRLTAAVCSPAKLRFGPGVILGRVTEAVSQKPAAGAEVSVAWTETEVGKDIGLRTVPRVRKATVQENGTYRICGVPPSFSGTLQAIRGGSKTAEVPIEVADQGLTMRILYLPPPQTADASANGVPRTGPPVGKAVIKGKVTNAGGVPVPGARVSVQGSPGSVSTGDDGTFILTGVLPGTQAILVRRVGYAPVERPMDVKELASNELTVRLGRFTPVLSTVEVTENRNDPLAATGFESRRKMGMGKYLDEKALEEMHPLYTSDALRRLVGLSVTGSGYGAQVTTTRGQGCVNYLVDRNPMSTNGMSIDNLVNPQDIAAIEFYQPADVPMELSAGAGGCAVVVIWTKGQLKRTSK